MTAVAVAAVLLVAGCGSGKSAPAAARAAGDAGSSAAAAGTTSGSASASGSAAVDAASTGTGRVARFRTGAPLTVRTAPRDAATTAVTLPAATPLGSTRVLMVLAVQDGWVEVALPVRPNGAVGWVRTSDVELGTVPGRLVVDLSARTLTMRSGGRTLWSTKVAVGAAATVTPRGAFYVTDRVRPTNPGGSYGPFALGISAHSEKLTEFGDGDAQIGIHGTDEPRSIGTASTHGCIRVPNAMAGKLQDVPLGTPVDIVDRTQR